MREHRVEITDDSSRLEISIQDHDSPASAAVPRGTASIGIRSSGDASRVLWFAPAGTSTFAKGATMTKAPGSAVTIAAPADAGSYEFHVLDAEA